MNYLVNALMEEDHEEEDAVALKEEQKGFLFLLVKTVIDVLDQKGCSRKVQYGLFIYPAKQ